MKIKFNVKTQKSTDGSITPILEHSFFPLEENKEVEIVCDYLNAGERATYVGIGSTSLSTLDMRRLFSAKVKEIKGLEIELNDKETMKITTAEELLAMPEDQDLFIIVQNTALHLLLGDGLKAEEVKN